MGNRRSVFISDGFSGVQFEVLAEVTDADCEWETKAVIRRLVDGKLFFAEDWGCSCTAIADRLTTADLNPIYKFSEAKIYCDGNDEWQLLSRSYDQSKPIYRDRRGQQ